MFHYIAKNKGVLILIAIVFASFLWMTSQVRESGGPSLLDRGITTVIYPFVYAVDLVSDTASGVWNGYFYLVGLVRQNEKLAEENGKLFIENTMLKERLARTGRLDALWKMKERSSYPSIPAGVVGRDPTSWFRSLMVDAGTEDGAAKDMPAAEYSGLVGRVMKPYTFSSRVMLITHPGSSVSCIIERSRDTGILVGDGTATCRLDYVDKKADVKEGDLVITSGLDRVFPKGMPVGVVTEVNPDAPGIFQEVRVTPTADLAHIEDLLILVYKPEARE